MKWDQWRRRSWRMPALAMLIMMVLLLLVEFRKPLTSELALDGSKLSLGLRIKARKFVAPWRGIDKEVKFKSHGRTIAYEYVTRTTTSVVQHPVMQHQQPALHPTPTPYVPLTGRATPRCGGWTAASNAA